MEVVKRCGEIVPFESEKIYKAILKAMKYGSGIVKNEIAKQIAEEAVVVFEFDEIPPTVEQIEDFVYFSLLDNDEELTAKSYEGYRAVQAYKREVNTTDDSILSLINRVNEEVMNENSNKNAVLASTQRDLIAGEVSKDIARRKLIPPYIVQAHDEGVINYHDLDYSAQSIHNCGLINLEDMLDNGTVINKKMVKSPRSFSTACTVTTQIIAQIASGQYGGSSMTIKHLAKYLRKSYENRHYRLAMRSMTEYLTALPKMDIGTYKQTVSHFKSIAKEEAKKNMMQELRDGVQTIRYQLSTLQTSNGQNPFATIYLEIEEGHEYEYEMALICEEMIKQRIEGMESETGHNIGEEFPKLVYLVDKHNCLEGGKYDYITKLSAICSAKRLVPDYQSAKIMRENYEGNTFPPMGQQIA